MSARSAVLALLILCGFAAPGAAAEHAGTAIVLQLPPSMPPAAVRALLAELVAKGARPAALPIHPAAADPGTSPTSAVLVARIGRATLRALHAFPTLSEAPRSWVERVVAGGGTAGVALCFWIVALVGLAAPPLIGRGVRAVLEPRLSAGSEPMLASRLRAAAQRFAIALAALAIFGLVFWTALLGIASGNRFVDETADRLVWAVLQWRLAIVALITVFCVERRDLRLAVIGDADARTCVRWFSVYAALSPLNLFAIWLIERIGYPQQTVFGAALVFGVCITAYKIAMFWVTRGAIGRAILAATGSDPGPLRRAVAASWHWFFILLSLAILFAAWVAFALGKGASVAGASAATQAIVLVLAVLWQAGHKLIARHFTDPAMDVPPILRHRGFRRALNRLCNALLAILGAAWLAENWGFDLVDPPPGSFERLFVRPALLAAVTVVGLWIVWTVLSAVIDEKMPHGAVPGDEDDAAAVASRLGTLLPLVRNLVLIALGVIALIVTMATLGFDIGPLLAGLGVVGIAVGFGAQHLVRDIISGVFFLMEDAFRVGEYIDTGRLRGTVEGMSLRSVRLRHQNGQVHTIPFGQVQAVTNFSRDWAVVKFNLHLDPAAEIETVRRTIKRVGQELLEDPEIGADFIQPLKLQGVIDVLQNALVVRCKFTATPTRPTYLQRQALRSLIEAFTAAGIRFAAPNVMVQLAAAG